MRVIIICEQMGTPCIKEFVEIRNEFDLKEYIENNISSGIEMPDVDSIYSDLNLLGITCLDNTDIETIFVNSDFKAETKYYN